MSRSRRPLTIALALLPAIVLALGTVASAAPRRCGDPGRPPCTILRPPELGPPPETSYGAPECIVVVGGFGSTNGDRAFDDLFEWTRDGTPYQVFHFGYRRDERFPYDTTGPIDVSAEDLRSFTRSLTPDCRAIHVVAHSMGGAVADRAFKMGLSSSDGVATYVALSSPHNGATLAKALRTPVERDPLIAIEIGVLARTLEQPDPTTPAGRDLATIERPRRSIRGDIASARLRVATDAMVLRRDNADRRADVREYFALDALEGHGGILHNEQVRRVLHTTIAAKGLAVDNRSSLERRVADAVSQKLDEKLSALYQGLGSYLSTNAFAPVALADAYVAVAVGKVIGEAISEALESVSTSRFLVPPGPLSLVEPSYHGPIGQ